MMTNLSFGMEHTAEDVTQGLDLSGRRFVVTGCNSGLGYETCRVLALRGATIVGLARSIDRAQQALDELSIDGTAVACDLGNLHSVAAAVDSIRKLGPVHGLIANAGVMALPELRQIEGYELQFFTNHIGHFALVTGLIDSLAADGRVVMLSSGAHTMAPEAGIEFDNLSGERGYDAWKAYGQSKLANLMFAGSLAKRFEGSSRTANSVHPGVIDTNLGRHVANRAEMYERLKPHLKTIPQGASTQCLVATHPSLASVSGFYFSDNQLLEPKHPMAKNDEIAERLWRQSETICCP
jgi:NAD(P)-dependent dehydrogenase (short-subunit alcohol dehydrogenase family)